MHVSNLSYLDMESIVMKAVSGSEKSIPREDTIESIPIELKRMHQCVDCLACWVVEVGMQIMSRPIHLIEERLGSDEYRLDSFRISAVCGHSMDGVLLGNGVSVTVHCGMEDGGVMNGA